MYLMPPEAAGVITLCLAMVESGRAFTESDSVNGAQREGNASGTMKQDGDVSRT